MDMQFVLTTYGDGVSFLTLDRPDKRNALSGPVLEELATAIARVAKDSRTRVMILRGNGPAFCAGLDLGELEEPGSLGSLDSRLIERVLKPLEACPQPTIAMVHGDAIAGGCELALHCDLRVAATDALFAMPVARIGLAAPYPLTLKLVETIGVAATKELLFTGEAIGAERALALGMVNRVVPAAALEESALSLAAAIAGNAPIAVAAMKEYVRRAGRALTDLPHDDLAVWAERIRGSADLCEGLLARRERRRPVFQGR
jgi:enoyl-CoA hydratase/carnithine racemase